MQGFAITSAGAAALTITAALIVWAPWRAEPDRPLVRLDVDLGADVALPPETFDQNVVLSPDGTRLAYVARGSGGQTRLHVRRLDQDKAMELAGTEGVVSAAFSPDSNSLAFLTGNSVYRISVQGGAAIRLSDGDVSNNSLAWSEDGSILVAGLGAGLRRIPGSGGEQVTLTDLAEGEAIHAQPFPMPGGKTVLFASGTRLRNSRTPLLAKVGPYYDPRVSPDASQIALTLTDTSLPSVGVYDPRRDGLTRLSLSGSNVNPIWSRDGRYVIFISLEGALDGALFWTRVGAGRPQALGGDRAIRLGSFSPDGKRLAYVRRGSVKGRPLTTEIVTTTVTEENGQLKPGTAESFSPLQANETEPEFSPDGKWIAFETDRSGRQEVAVRAFPVAPSGGTPEAMVSNNGGVHPRWSPSGRELFYLEGDRIMSVTFTVNGDTFVPDKPRVFLEKAGRQWDVAPDGRLAIVEPSESQPGAVPAADHHVVFLEHFIDEVKRRVQ
jgi:Tol biopolymer transport system component